ncbi:hypothetical protein LXM94_15465 [Rhizobium sp. TRM95111]|uniref:hypothetical protein n=1 Tax=Rhizobium alarense TaxID=2846851 RepID=UPI001F49017B|nr:hypothetical protein [Rhizobium alarense]MCF3641372.1 hypothetical protein [Rhizobium alarense]
MSGDPAERCMALVEATLSTDGAALTPLAAAILAACHLGIAADSRSFARALGLAHAFVLREIEDLVSERRLLVVTDRDRRTQRIFYRLSEAGERRLGAAALSLC